MPFLQLMLILTIEIEEHVSQSLIVTTSTTTLFVQFFESTGLFLFVSQITVGSNEEHMASQRDCIILIHWHTIR